LRQISRRKVTLGGGAATLALTSPLLAKPRKPPPSTPSAIEPVVALAPQVAYIRDGVRLCYVDTGIGAPVVFVHGALSDYRYWEGQVRAFGQAYRAIAYSRRYNWPNDNPARRGYSAALDAEDLAWFIDGLNIAPAHIVGHAEGALTALFLASRHPQLVRTVTLAEPPAISLLAHLPGERAAEGVAMLKDVQAHMVAPMRAAFARHDTEGGVRAFLDYMTGPGTWDAFSADGKAAMLKNAHEWEVTFAGGELFSEITPAQVARVSAPVLRLSGAKSPPFLGLIDQALYALLPQSQHIVFANADDQLWLEEAEACRRAVFGLIGGHSR
jgi:pimeloyl-ACP methyl ester carboxylesterase